MSISSDWEDQVKQLLNKPTTKNWTTRLNNAGIQMLRAEVEEGTPLQQALLHYDLLVGFHLPKEVMKQTHELAYKRYNPEGSYDELRDCSRADRGII